MIALEPTFVSADKKNDAFLENKVLKMKFFKKCPTWKFVLQITKLFSAWKLALKIKFWWFLLKSPEIKKPLAHIKFLAKNHHSSMLCNKSVVILILQSKGAGQMPAQIRLVCFLVQVLQFVQFFRWPTFTDTAFNWTLGPSTNDVLIKKKSKIHAGVKIYA